MVVDILSSSDNKTQLAGHWDARIPNDYIISTIHNFFACDITSIGVASRIEYMIEEFTPLS